MMFVSRKSGWNFVTAGSAGVNIDVFAVSGGQVVLSDPRNTIVRFDYGGAGAGIGIGISLPKIGKLEVKPLGKSITGTVAPEQFPNTGVVYMTDFFKGAELAKADFKGACIFTEGGVGLIDGYSATVMLVGIDPAKLATAVATPILNLIVGRAEPKAVILIKGPNFGLQFGGGVAGYLGYMM